MTADRRAALVERVADIISMVFEGQGITDTSNGVIDLIRAEVLEDAAEIERLRAALVALRDGCETRPVGVRYREDGQPSKHDKCIHGVWMYEDCGQCVSLFVEAALAQKANDVC